VASLDLACVALVALAAVGGGVTGALGQIASGGAAVAGWIGARVVGPRLAPLVQGHVPAFTAGPAATVLAFAVCAFAAWIALRALGASLRAGTGASRADRGLGALLGGAKAALVLWVLLSALALWGRPVDLGPVHVDPAGSDLVARARDHGAIAAAHRALHGGAARRR
jgi:membrane protein required for colicin V production